MEQKNLWGDISRQLFIETINELQKQFEHDEKCRKAFGVILPDAEVIGYDNHFVVNQMVKLLQVLTLDEKANSWIEYFINDLEFGKLWKKGRVTVNKKDFVLKDASDLWNLLSVS